MTERTDRLRTIALAGLAMAATACGAFASDLGRAREAYDQARYEDALVWLDDLEQWGTMPANPDLRAQFFYLRGMTAYRLQQRSDALYYLAVAKELTHARSEAVLGTQADRTLERTLAQLQASPRAASPTP